MVLFRGKNQKQWGMKIFQLLQELLHKLVYHILNIERHVNWLKIWPTRKPLSWSNVNGLQEKHVYRYEKWLHKFIKKYMIVKQNNFIITILVLVNQDLISQYCLDQVILIWHLEVWQLRVLNHQKRHHVSLQQHLHQKKLRCIYREFGERVLQDVCWWN